MNKDNKHIIRAAVLCACILLLPSVGAYNNGIPANWYREIIADAPWRVETSSIPVLIFINDAGSLTGLSTAPFQLSSVYIYEGNRILKNKTYDVFIHADANFGLSYEGSTWYDIIDIPVNDNGLSGDVQLTVRIMGINILRCPCFYISNETEREKCRQTNECFNLSNTYPETAGHWYITMPETIEQTLTVKVAADKLPKFDGWSCGDVHHHTIYTDNPVPGIAWLSEQGEIGAPVQASMEAAKAMGLGWVTVTDHSDDMSDEKWGSFKPLCNGYDASDGVVCIPSQEVTCNWPIENTPIHKGVSHYLAYGMNNWISGTAYSWSYPCTYVVEEVNRQGVGYVAHPMEVKGGGDNFGIMIQWQDYSLNTSGYEVWNVESKTDDFKKSLTGSDDGRVKGYDDYIVDFLRKYPDKRIYMSGGSDAHGEFNDVFSDKGAFGKPRTCCELDSFDRSGVL